MRVALVTGGNRGIGQGITRRLVADGFAVSVLATREEPGDLLAELRELAGSDDAVRYVRGSVADLADHERYVEDAVDAWGRLDLLVNNAGVAPAVRADLLEATPESFDRVLGINLRGPYFLTQTFARHVIALRGDVPVPTDRPVATVVNISSIRGFSPDPGRIACCAAKAAVIMMAKVAAEEWTPHGVRVNAVAPGFVATDIIKAMPEKVIAGMVAKTPVGRMGKPEDIAEAYFWLASDAASFVHGATLSVDGGLVLGT